MCGKYEALIYRFPHKQLRSRSPLASESCSVSYEEWFFIIIQPPCPRELREGNFGNRSKKPKTVVELIVPYE